MYVHVVHVHTLAATVQSTEDEFHAANLSIPLSTPTWYCLEAISTNLEQ